MSFSSFSHTHPHHRPWMVKRPRSRVAAQAHERAEQRLFLRYPQTVYFSCCLASSVLSTSRSVPPIYIFCYVSTVIVSSDSDPRAHRHWRARSAVYQSSSRSLTIGSGDMLVSSGKASVLRLTCSRRLSWFTAVFVVRHPCCSSSCAIW